MTHTLITPKFKLMKQLISLIALGTAFLIAVACNNTEAKKGPNPYYDRTATTPLKVTDTQWKAILPANVSIRRL